MENITQKENDLFDKWGHHIVKDGVVDIELFMLTKIKILIIMKETNDYVNEEQDLRIFLKKGARGATWNNIVRWIYGLKNLTQKTDDLWQHISYIDNNKRIQYLSQISSINLKKRPGASSTNLSELQQETANDIQYLQKQISFYKNINFVICGSRDVSNLVQKYNMFGNIKFMQHVNSYVKIAESEYSNAIIISYYHPQVRGKGSSKEELFKNLINAIKDYFNNKENMFVD